MRDARGKFKVLVVHGPNLNLLGRREPQTYGRVTLDEINSTLQAMATERGAELCIVQSDHEGGLIDALHEAHLSNFHAREPSVTRRSLRWCAWDRSAALVGVVTC